MIQVSSLLPALIQSTYLHMNTLICHITGTKYQQCNCAMHLLILDVHIAFKFLATLKKMIPKLQRDKRRLQ